MFGERRPRDYIVFGLTAVTAFFLIGGFFLPHTGLKSFVKKDGDWLFGWSGEGLEIVFSILALLIGLGVVALLVLKLPKAFKGLAFVGAAFLLLGVHTLQSCTDHFASTMSAYPAVSEERAEKSKKRLEKRVDRACDEDKKYYDEDDCKEAKKDREEGLEELEMSLGDVLSERREKICDKDDDSEGCEQLSKAVTSMRSETLFMAQPLWFNHLLFIFLLAMAVMLSLNSESSSRTGRVALGILAGGAMMSIALIPFPLEAFRSCGSFLDSGEARLLAGRACSFDWIHLAYEDGGGVRPSTAWLESWFLDDRTLKRVVHEILPGSGESLEFTEWIVVLGRSILLAAGPIFGVLLLFHSMVVMVRPDKAIKGFGYVAGAVFALWLPAVYMFSEHSLVWSDTVTLPITNFIYFAVPFILPVLIGLGAYHIGEAMAEDPALKQRTLDRLRARLYGLGPNGVTVGAPTPWSPVPAGATSAGGPPAAGPPPGAMPTGGPSGYEATAAFDINENDPSAFSESQGPAASLPDPHAQLGNDATAALDVSQIDQFLAQDTGQPQAPQPPANPVPDGATAALDVSQIDQFLAQDAGRAQAPQPPANPVPDGATAALDVSQIDALMQKDRGAPKKPEGNVGFAATATWESGQFDDVFTAAKQARGETDIQQHLDAASAAWYAQDYPTARQHYEAVVALEPNHIDSLRAIGELYYYEGNLDQSEAFYKRVLALSPHDEASLEALRNIVLYRQGGQ